MRKVSSDCFGDHELRHRSVLEYQLPESHLHVIYRNQHEIRLRPDSADLSRHDPMRQGRWGGPCIFGSLHRAMLFSLRPSVYKIRDRLGVSQNKCSRGTMFVVLD